MKVRELIEQLANMDPETEVRLAQQPAWPFEYNIGRVVDVEIGHDAAGNVVDEDEDEVEVQYYENVVYIGEGEQLGYLLHGATIGDLGWR